jgi:hypothetical protein
MFGDLAVSDFADFSAKMGELFDATASNEEGWPAAGAGADTNRHFRSISLQAVQLML